MGVDSWFERWPAVANRTRLAHMSAATNSAVTLGLMQLAWLSGLDEILLNTCCCIGLLLSYYPAIQSCYYSVQVLRTPGHSRGLIMAPLVFDGAASLFVVVLLRYSADVCGVTLPGLPQTVAHSNVQFPVWRVGTTAVVVRSGALPACLSVCRHATTRDM
jgi:hypothetical protein